MAGVGTVSVNQSPQRGPFPSDKINYPSRTKARHAYKHKVREWLNSVREHVVCEYCGSRHNLIWHHRDPEDKAFNVGTGDRSIATIVKEMAKCDILCRFCHADAHETRRA